MKTQEKKQLYVACFKQHLNNPTEYLGVETFYKFENYVISANKLIDKNRDERGRFCTPHWETCNGNYVAKVGAFAYDTGDNYYSCHDINKLTTYELDDIIASPHHYWMPEEITDKILQLYGYNYGSDGYLIDNEEEL
jgi:hypothetical protein